MNIRVILISFLFSLVIYSCSNSKKSEEVASYKYEEEKVEMNPELKVAIPDWVKEGTECYGLIVQLDGNKNPVRGKPVKAKVVQIQENYVKMKSLEAVNLIEIEGCTKYMIDKGETWDEKDGDLYRTREEAIEALKKMKLYRQSDRATVD